LDQEIDVFPGDKTGGWQSAEVGVVEIEVIGLEGRPINDQLSRIEADVPA
jgi:hypothetical protein